MAHIEDLNPLYGGENQLQAINSRAARIEKETGITVSRCHLGNPLGPQYGPSDDILAEYYRNRRHDIDSRGYANVVGKDRFRVSAAHAMEAINRLPRSTINESNVLLATGGTGALNIALSVLKDASILVQEPYYPPWKNITERVGNHFATFPLRREDQYLLNESVIDETITRLEKERPDKPVMLIYHYPNNPTGKTLDDKEAEQVAATLNNLCKKHKRLYLLQEDLYLATTASDMGIYTPLPYLDENAKQRTIWINSPSKMGHPQDRGALIAAFNPVLVEHLRGAASFDSLGSNAGALAATANTLLHIAQTGLNERGARGTHPSSHRYATADYYQQRIGIVYDALKEIERAIPGAEILEIDKPKGAYYLYPNMELLKGKKIPDELLPAFNGKTSFESADDVATALENAHLLGLRPMTVASGNLFTSNPQDMHLRIATVEPELENLQSAGNTLKGLVQKTLGVDLKAEFMDEAALRERYSVARKLANRPAAPYLWNKNSATGHREWSVNPGRRAGGAGI